MDSPGREWAWLLRIGLHTVHQSTYRGVLLRTAGLVELSKINVSRGHLPSLNPIMLLAFAAGQGRGSTSKLQWRHVSQAAVRSFTVVFLPPRFVFSLALAMVWNQTIASAKEK